MTTTRHRLVAGGLTMALTLLGPTAAIAQTDERTATEQDRPTADIDTVKERAEAAIQRRLLTIDRLQYAVRSNLHLTDDHRASLLAELDGAAIGLQGLEREIAAAGTLERLRSLLPAIAEDYRIYVLVAPKVAEVIASDTVVDVVARVGIAADELEQAIARAEEAGYDASEAEEHLVEMTHLASEAESLAAPVAAAVLPLQPADWPDPARTVLEQAHDDLVSARRALREARDAAHDALTALREAISG